MIGSRLLVATIVAGCEPAAAREPAPVSPPPTPAATPAKPPPPITTPAKPSPPITTPAKPPLTPVATPAERLVPAPEWLGPSANLEETCRGMELDVAACAAGTAPVAIRDRKDPYLEAVRIEIGTSAAVLAVRVPAGWFAYQMLEADYDDPMGDVTVALQVIETEGRPVLRVDAGVRIYDMSGDIDVDHYTRFCEVDRAGTLACLWPAR